jgi:hypothetical protein
MSRRRLLILLGWVLALLLLANLRELVRGQTDWRIYAFLSVIVLFGVPLLVGVGVFVLYIVNFIVHIIKWIRER